MQYQVALLASSLALTAATPAARAGITLFLERHGGTVTAGHDDAEAGSSSLVYSRGLRAVRVPAFAGTDAGWERVVA